MPSSATRFAIMVDGANLLHGLVATHGRKRAPATLTRVLRHLTVIVTEREPGGVVAGRDIFLIDEAKYRSSGAEAERSGFTVHFVPSPQLTEQERADGHSRADDNALKRHVIDAVGRFDTLVLVTNDGDFVPLVEQMQSAGRRVIVASYETTGEKGPHLSRELKKAANDVVSLRRFADLEVCTVDDASTLPPTSSPKGSKVEVYQQRSLIYELEVQSPIIEVGRGSRSRDHWPDIDLKEEDAGMILSRQHLRLRFVSPGRAVAQIHLRCSSPTWCNGSLIHPGESVLITSSDELLLGDHDTGFHLVIQPI